MRIAELPDDTASIDAFVALCVALDPFADDLSRDDLQRWDQMAGEHFRVGAHHDGKLVAAGAVYGQPYDPECRTLPCQLLVPANLRDQGLGDALLAPLAAWARRRRSNPRLSVGISSLDSGLIAFWNERGLTEADRYVELELLLQDVRPGSTAPFVQDPRPGSRTPRHEVVSLAERPGLLVPTWEVIRDTWHDMPGEDSVPPPLDEWRQRFDDGHRPLGGALLALDDAGRPAGATTTGARPGDLDRAWTAFTGVRAEARGRGIATALKLRQVEWCRSAGYRRLTTGNHLGNAPMLAINERLGFRESKVVVQLQGDAP